MARPRPKNPELLAATIAVLRAHAEDRDGDAFERGARARMTEAGVDKAVAGRLVQRYDAIRPAVRRDALGEWADRPVVLAADRAPRAGTVLSADVTITGDLGGGGSAGGGAAGGGSTAFGGLGGRFHDIVVGDLFELTPTNGSTYAVDYVGFVCEDETDWDRFTNSDEVYVITSAVTVNDDGSNQVRTEKHPVDRSSYGDVDRGEVRLGPIARCYEGARLPVSLTVVAFEHDDGNPNEYRDEIDALVKAAIAAAILIFGLGAGVGAILEGLSGTITDAINWLFDTDDDQIDIDRTHILEQSRIEEMGTRPLNVHIYNQNILGVTRPVVTDLMHHFVSTHSGDGARYTFGFRVSRDPAFEVVEGPFL